MHIPLKRAYSLVYTYREVTMMKTAKLFSNGSSQAVRLPKEFRFDGDEIGVTRMGEMLLLYPKNRAHEIFLASLGEFTEDFYASVEQAHTQETPDAPRDGL
jgi:antitoxin VapB